jgi:hypothetical protein
MVIGIWRYFDFLSSKAGPIEDLYLNFLEFLDLERYNERTFVDTLHHEAFRNVVLKDELMRQILSQTEEHRSSALNPPDKYLDLIYSIRQKLPFMK